MLEHYWYFQSYIGHTSIVSRELLVMSISLSRHVNIFLWSKEAIAFDRHHINIFLLTSRHKEQTCPIGRKKTDDQSE